MALSFSAFVVQIVYILSSGSQEQNLRQIYRLLDDKQVTFRLFGLVWSALILDNIYVTADMDNQLV